VYSPVPIYLRIVLPYKEKGISQYRVPYGLVEKNEAEKDVKHEIKDKTRKMTFTKQQMSVFYA
jgi:hypothetical protein